MRSRPSIVVVIPAHDEASVIADTLRSVVAALRSARRRRVIGQATVQVVAHRCADETAARAAATLRGLALGDVVEDVESASIGRVRDQGVRRGIARLGSPPTSTWVLSTDADTCVPRDWVVRILAAAGRHDAFAVVGLAELDRFRGSRRALAAYDALLSAKMRPGDDAWQHDHVYGANLAVRADAYLAVGGFPHVRHGEDQQLVDALLRHGVPVLRSREVVVTTSGRLDGRAEGGLASLLRDLDEPRHVSPDQSWASVRRGVNAAASPPTVKG